MEVSSGEESSVLVREEEGFEEEEGRKEGREEERERREEGRREEGARKEVEACEEDEEERLERIRGVVEKSRANIFFALSEG